MSLMERYQKAMKDKNESEMNDILHDDFKFTMHSSGNVLSKSDVVGWAMSDDINSIRHSPVSYTHLTLPTTSSG